MLQAHVKGTIASPGPSSGRKMSFQSLQPFNKMDVLCKPGFLVLYKMRPNDRLSRAKLQSLLGCSISKLKNSHDSPCDAVCKRGKPPPNVCICVCWITTLPLYAKPAKIFTLLLSLVELTGVSWSRKLWYIIKIRNCYLHYIWIQS